MNRTFPANDQTHARPFATPDIIVRSPTWETLAQHAIDAARHAGAQYADVRFTHTLFQSFSFLGPNVGGCKETIGIGIRALVNGYWGFTATPGGEIADVEGLARAAVAQAHVNAQGPRRTVELGTVPPAIGHWTMPVAIDPFTVPIEEKLAMMRYWLSLRTGGSINAMFSNFYFTRWEDLVATSEGALFTQTRYEGGASIVANNPNRGRPGSTLPILGVMPQAKGWELLLDADIPGQLAGMNARFAQKNQDEGNAKPAQVGRYTLVCDGATMASLTDRTLGIATQLDRALGYEANASGTSFLNDPLAMLGAFQVGSPLVTMTANRSAPGQLATVKWDTEGVEPHDFPLIKAGVLADYQTTREQAAWLAPYYQKSGTPVRSRGCAAVESALSIPMQHAPNLALAHSSENVDLDALIASVSTGVLIRDGHASCDFMARSGTLSGTMYEIRNGRVGRLLTGGAISFDTLGLWKNISALGGKSTLGMSTTTRWPYETVYLQVTKQYPVKGQPPQLPSYTTQAPATTITKQAIINLSRKA
jgi:TldD protein